MVNGKKRMAPKVRGSRQGYTHQDSLRMPSCILQLIGLATFPDNYRSVQCIYSTRYAEAWSTSKIAPSVRACM